MAVLASVAAGVAAIVFLLLRNDSPPPLASVELSDGSVVELRDVTTAGESRYIIRPSVPQGELARSWTGPLLPEWHAPGDPFDTTHLWLVLRDAATGRPIDFPRLGYGVLVDDNGWPHVSRRRVRAAYRGNRFAFAPFFDDHPGPEFDHGREVRPQPLAPLPSQNYAEVVLGLMFPLLPPQQATLQLYSPDQELIASLPVTIPDPPPPVPYRMIGKPLPQTAESNGLSVTLEELKIVPLPERLRGVRTYRLEPQLSLSWLGDGPSGWGYPEGRQFYFRVNGQQVQRSDEVFASPYAGAWVIDFDVPHSRRASRHPQHQWETGPLEIPPPGEKRDVNLAHSLEGVDIRLLTLYGPGRREFSTELPGSPGTGGGSRVESGDRVTLRRQPRPNGTNWMVDADGVVAVLELRGPNAQFVKLDPTADGEETYENGSSGDSHGELMHHVGEIEIPRNAKTLSLRVVVNLPMKFPFTVNPEQLDLPPEFRNLGNSGHVLERSPHPAIAN